MKKNNEINKKKIFTILYIFLITLFFIIIELILRLINFGLNTNLFFKVKIDNNKYNILNNRFINKYYPGIKKLRISEDKIFFPDKRGKKDILGFVIGGSTAEGYPYQANHSFSKMLQVALEQTNLFDNVYIENLGFSAMSSYYVYDVSKKLLKYKPDFIVIYSGHNEYYGTIGHLSGGNYFTKNLYLFLKEFKIIQFLLNFTENSKTNLLNNKEKSLMELMFNNSTIPQNEKIDKEVANNFIKNIDKTINLFKSKKIPVIIIEPISNIFDFAPFKGGINDNDIIDFIINYNKAIENKNIQEVKNYYDESIKNNYFNNNAIIKYLIGKSQYLLEQKDYLKTLIQAKDLDNIPFRAREQLIKSLRIYIKNNNYNNLYYISLFNEFNKFLEKDVFGNKIFCDHLHFNFETNHYVSYLLFKIIIQNILKQKDFDKNLINNYISIEQMKQLINFIDLNEFYAYSRLNSILNDNPYKNMIIKYNSPLEKKLLTNEIINNKELLNIIVEKNPDLYGLYLIVMDYYDKKMEYNKLFDLGNSFYNLFPGNYYSYNIIANLAIYTNDLDQAINAFKFAYILSGKNYNIYKNIENFYLTYKDKKSFDIFIQKYGKPNKN